MSDQDQQQQTGQQPAHTREPMTAERLAGIANTTKHARTVAGPFSIWMQVTADTDYLLAFAEAALPILRAVADGDATRLDDYEDEHCTWCIGEAERAEDIRHTPDCPVTVARALLAGQTAAAAPVAADVDAIGTRCSSCGGSGMLATPIELAGDPLECPACGGTGIRKNDWHEEEEGEW